MPRLELTRDCAQKGTSLYDGAYGSALVAEWAGSYVIVGKRRSIGVKQIAHQGKKIAREQYLDSNLEAQVVSLFERGMSDYSFNSCLWKMVQLDAILRGGSHKCHRSPVHTSPSDGERGHPLGCSHCPQGPVSGLFGPEPSLGRWSS